MISLITTCDPQRLYLVPWFVKHYRACGVERFYINLHFDTIYPPGVQPDLVAQANAILRDLDLRLHSVYSGLYEAAAARRHHDAIRSEIAADSSWIVWADIDEFHEYSDSLAALTAHMHAHSIDYIQSFFVDRMARAGLPRSRAASRPGGSFRSTAAHSAATRGIRATRQRRLRGAAGPSSIGSRASRKIGEPMRPWKHLA